MSDFADKPIKEPGTDTTAKKAADMVRKEMAAENSEQRERKWNHWGVIFAGFVVFAGIGFGLVKTYIMIPATVEAHEKALVEHDKSISLLRSTSQDTATMVAAHEKAIQALNQNTAAIERERQADRERLIRIEDAVESIKQQLQQLRGHAGNEYGTNFMPGIIYNGYLSGSGNNHNAGDSP